jgi:16S rRNA (cytidine1402-2'-O)-methyltransferase
VHDTAGDRREDTHTAASGASARFRAEPGTLYVVATPLGNLRDVTLRALDVLGSADVVAVEDTRVTAVLLRHYGIATRPMALHEHNEATRAVPLVAALRAGRSVALVSDAGTPAISDPGARLVRAARDAGLPVVPVPGACAAIAAVSAAGLVAEHFAFLGFLPRAAKARRDVLAAYAGLPCALAIYEAPHRVRATIDDLAAVLGGERELTVGRELTKKFETIARMRLDGAAQWFAGDAHRERGELVLLVDRPVAVPAQADGSQVPADARKWLAALAAELPPARAARVVAAVTGAPRDDLYALASALKSGGR